MMATVAARLRCTEGQAYTLAVGLVLATLLSLAGPGSFPVPLAAAPAPLAPTAAGATAASSANGGAAPVPPPPSPPPATERADGGGSVTAAAEADPGSGPASSTSDRPSAGDVTALTVRSSAWASALAGTPLDLEPIGDDRLPVANRFGQVDKASFVRLAGTDGVLHLVEDEAAARELVGPAEVAICAVRESTWEERSGQALGEAPAWDPDACVIGVESAPGEWSFDLSTFADPTGDAGFALVPGPSAPFDFQVAFER